MALHFKLLLLLALYTISASGDNLLRSIDCGSSSTSLDSSYIRWEEDSEFFLSGTSSVESVQSSNSLSDVLDTLRVFNNAQKKNCYDLQLSTIGEMKVLVRASFNYGNYDKKSSPPTFDLLIDGNFWDTVNTSTAIFNDNNVYIYHEVIYVVKRDYLSVCLVQTKPNQFPFISALEVRSLESDMYSVVDSTVALILKTRRAFGASSSIRDEPYDRIWSTNVVGTGQVKIASDEIFVDNDNADKPPQSMLLSAITTSATSQPLILDMELSSATSQAYINWYFSEVTVLETTQKRSFEIFMNNLSISDPIIPPYDNVSELYVSKYSVPAGAVFSLVATTDSDLPPIINGMEVFIISDVLTEGTNIDDIKGLAALGEAFSVLTAWGGDPCLPSQYSWEWVNCSFDDVPRIKALNLKGYGLEGLIPDLSSMDALETINFQNNKLVGPIPDSLGSLPKLKNLNVADNKLSGPIPTSVSKINLVWSGNPSLCKSGCQVDNTSGYVPTPPSSNTPVYVSRSKKSKTGIIVGTTIPLFIVFWGIVGLIVVLRKRRTAAVAAAIASANRPKGKPHGGANSEMAGDIGEAAEDVFMANVGPPGDQTGNQPHHQV